MYKRIVVKIGTKVLTENDRFSERILQQITDQVAALRAQGIEVVIVTSGAVAAGRDLVNVEGIEGSLEQRQVLAAVGQVRLMSLYTQFFAKYEYQCAQLLVTKTDFRDRQHYANMKNRFENLLRTDVIPVVNENDTISVAKVAFADNDELAGIIASQLNADAVIFLTSVEGVMMQNGDGGEKVVPEIREADFRSFEVYISDKKSAGGYGGMRNKFAIAKRLMAQGITVHIADGKRPSVLTDLADGKALGTTFVPAKKLSSMKRRLAYSEGLTLGAVYVDAGAEKVLLSGKSRSLLPVGVKKIEGEFKKGDTIEIRSEGGTKLGFGVAQYAAAEAQNLMGKKGGRALIHYDYLVIGD